MARKLFCELCPAAYRLSRRKEILRRKLQDLRPGLQLARTRQEEKLPVCISTHRSLIRRTLGQVDSRLQENKAVNLALSAPKISGVLIRPGETFSFWTLVGDCTEKDGYLPGLTISGGAPSAGVGGGMCQMTNLIHWMILHSPLTITERHHHDRMDLFPDYHRQVPFGVGTSICYNYLDYRFRNDTDRTYQLILYTTERYLCGELRCSALPECKYHIRLVDEWFTHEADGVYRSNIVERIRVDRKTGEHLSEEVISRSHAKICYDESFVPPEKFRDN